MLEFLVARLGPDDHTAVLQQRLLELPDALLKRAPVGVEFGDLVLLVTVDVAEPRQLLLEIPRTAGAGRGLRLLAIVRPSAR